jgi:hypothetical protein
MDANTIIQIISSLGFPIVMCGALFWYMVKQRQAHQEETEHLKDTIAENTKVLAELTTLIKVLTNEKERQHLQVVPATSKGQRHRRNRIYGKHVGENSKYV